jgi:VanZ family protein
MTMYRMQYPRLWLGLGWGLVGLVVILSLLPGKTLHDFNFLVSDKIQHAFAYATVMIWFAGIYRSSSYRWIVPGLVIMGITLEFLQQRYFHRHFEVRDMLANTAGVITGLILARYVFGGWCARVERRLMGRGAAGDDSDGG